MQRHNYPLKQYIKVVESIVEEKNGLERVEVAYTKGSIVRFVVFAKDSSDPLVMWTIHYAHNKKKEVWSPEDYKKAARNLSCEYSDFMKRFQK